MKNKVLKFQHAKNLAWQETGNMYEEVNRQVRKIAETYRGLSQQKQLSTKRRKQA